MQKEAETDVEGENHLSVEREVVDSCWEGPDNS